MIDQIICLVAGVFIGSVITMFVIALMFASRRAEDSGVDEVLDNLEKKAKENDK